MTSRLSGYASTVYREKTIKSNCFRPNTRRHAPTVDRIKNVSKIGDWRGHGNLAKNEKKCNLVKLYCFPQKLKKLFAFFEIFSSLFRLLLLGAAHLEKLAFELIVQTTGHNAHTFINALFFPFLAPLWYCFCSNRFKVWAFWRDLKVFEVQFWLTNLGSIELEDRYIV